MERTLAAYTRDQLFQLHCSAQPVSAAVDRVRSLGLRATRCQRCRLANDAWINPPSCRRNSPFVCRYRGRRSGRYRPPPSTPSKRSDRHSQPQGKLLNFGALNIRSLENKLETLLQVRNDQLIDVLFLVETWHDNDSVCLGRLRQNGFQVADRPRPRALVNTLTTNHGGIVVIAPPGVRLVTLDLGLKPATFELMCVRIAVETASCIAAVLYRPGSVAVTSQFFAELGDLMDRLATFVDPTLLLGDISPTCRHADVTWVHKSCHICYAQPGRTA